MNVHKKIEEFFFIASLGDSNSKSLLPQAIEYGLSNFEEWKITMDFHLNWIKNNEKLVLLNLAPLRKTWPNCCKVLEELLS